MKFLQILFIVSFILLTLITVKISPTVHKPMLIEDQDFVLTRISDTINVKNIPITPVVNKEKTQEIVIQPEQQEVDRRAIQEFFADKNNQNSKIIDVQNQETKNVIIPTQEVVKKDIKIDTPIQKSDKKIANLPKNEQDQTDLLNRLLNTPIEQIEVEIEEKDNKPVVNFHINDQPKAKPQEVKVETPKPKSSSNPYMTEQEEIIAWNVWRSNINNQIMTDSQIDFAPLGTVFTFSFVVDKFGNVSNINVSCSNQSFMDVARNDVKPAIARLQNKPILNFPRGTKRTSTVVNGMFAIGTRERYYSPNDFSDYERVTR